VCVCVCFNYSSHYKQRKVFAINKSLINFHEQGKCNENTGQDVDQPIGEIEDYSRHGTTVRLTPEHTKLNSPESPTKETKMEEDAHPSETTAFMLEHRVIV